MELWQALVGFGTVLIPVILTAMARDRSLIAMIKSAVDPVHERINRVRDEYVREDHLNAHLGRIDKRFDDLASEIRRQSEGTDKRLDEIRVLLQKRGQ